MFKRGDFAILGQSLYRSAHRNNDIFDEVFIVWKGNLSFIKKKKMLLICWVSGRRTMAKKTSPFFTEVDNSVISDKLRAERWLFFGKKSCPYMWLKCPYLVFENPGSQVKDIDTIADRISAFKKKAWVKIWVEILAVVFFHDATWYMFVSSWVAHPDSGNVI